MTYFKYILNFYINSSIHVALAVTSLCIITYINFNIPVNYTYVVFLFASSISGYNFVKYYGLAKLHYKPYVLYFNGILILSGIAFAVMLFLSFQLTYNTQIGVIILGLITFFYAKPLFSKKYIVDKHKNLRQISGLKIYIIAGIWAVATAYLPLKNAAIIMNSWHYIAVCQYFVFVFILMLPFEIRDLKYDSLKLATVPQQIGIKNTKILGYLLILVFLITHTIQPHRTEKETIVVIVIAVITFLSVLFMHTNKKRYYTSIWIESIPIIWCVLTVLFL